MTFTRKTKTKTKTADSMIESHFIFIPTVNVVFVYFVPMHLEFKQIEKQFHL